MTEERATYLLPIMQAAAAMSAAAKVVFRYDHDSDTLTIHFGDTPRPAVGVPIDGIDDAIIVREDQTSNQVVGMVIEGFTAGFIHRRPEIADVLERADVRGISRDDANAIAQSVNPNRVAFSRLLDRMAVA